MSLIHAFFLAAFELEARLVPPLARSKRTFTCSPGARKMQDTIRVRSKMIAYMILERESWLITEHCTLLLSTIQPTVRKCFNAGI